MNPPPDEISEGLARQHVLESLELPLDEADKCPDELLNRILWHAMKGTHEAYPVQHTYRQKK